MKTLKKKKAKNADAKQKTKKQSKAEMRAAKQAARKGDGSFPDILVVTKSGERKLYTNDAPDGPFVGHDAEDMSGLSIDGAEVAVYKLRRVSTVAINRKVVR